MQYKSAPTEKCFNIKQKKYSALKMDQLYKKFRCFIFVFCVCVCECKYIEGELRTSDDWAFLTRFCFLSEQGTFEFYFEFRTDQGFPNLLLYYDAPDQWPAVYKSDKNCRQRENVLHINQNQIVNLTVPKNALEDLAGCTLHVVESYPKGKGPVTTTRKPWRPFTTTKPTKKPFKTITTTMTSVDENTTMDINNTTMEETTNYKDFIIDNLEFIENITNDEDNIYDVDNMFGEDMDNITEPTEPPKSIHKRSVPQQSNPTTQNGLITCRNARKFRSSRARWWFIAVSNCGQKGIHLRYQVLMTNGRPGDYWHEHFSADEFYVLPVLMAFCIAYGLLIFSIIICSVELKSRQLLHTTYKLFCLSVVLQLVGIGLTTMAYLKYAVSGVLPYRTKILGGMFMGGCETIFLLLLLLLAKGYTTTRGRLPLSASVKLTIFMCLYAITYLTLFIYEAKVFDPGEVLYLYESPAGYGLIVLRIMAWWMFIYSTVFTLKHYPEKSNFYYPFNICGTLWFVAGPAFILSANSYVDKWVRESVVCGVLLFITFAGHLMFLILTLPAMANKNFPYHIRTTQIGVMEIQGVAGVGTLDQFNHHPYQPSAPPTDQVIIPLRPDDDLGDVFLARGLSREDEDDEEEREDNVEERGKAIGVGWRDGTAGSTRNGSEIKWSHVRDKLENGGASRIGSSRSTGENELPNGSVLNSPTSIFRAKSYKNVDNSLGNEWTKDVPVELFTISKMVINKQNTDK